MKEAKFHIFPLFFTSSAFFTSFPFFSSETKVQGDSKGPELAADSEAVGKEALKEENYVLPKSQESGRVTTLAQPRAASGRYGGRFQVLEGLI